MVLGDFRSRASCSMKARMSGFSCTRGQQAQLIVCIFVLLLVSGMFPQDITKVIPLNRHLVGWHAQVTQLLSRFHLAPLLISHFWSPFSADTTHTQAPDLIRSASGRHPDQTGSSLVGQRILWVTRVGGPSVLHQRPRCPDELEPAILLDVLRVGLPRAQAINGRLYYI